MDTVSTSDFEGERLAREPRTALVVFVADWCGYSRRFLRAAEPQAEGFPAPVLLADVSDEDDPLWDRFRLRIVPSLVLFKDGEPVWRMDGRSLVGLPPTALDEARKALEAAR